MIGQSVGQEGGYTQTGKKGPIGTLQGSYLRLQYIKLFYFIHTMHFLTFHILTNKMHKFKYPKTHHKTHFILST